jgi:murein DD-endopeptidase MepM/ murein hydrolase activator NlpD
MSHHSIKMWLVVMLLASAGTAGAAELATDSTPVAGWSLAWPVAPDDRGLLGNDYGQHNYVVEQKHHTGIDIGVGKGTPVLAAATGYLHLIQGNDTTCKSGSGCQDHGYGTTIILRHEVAGATYYTQYSHLSSVTAEMLEKCGAVDTAPFRRQCRAALVESGTVIASSGSTCKGKENCEPHLHFEVKTFGTLGTQGNDQGEWGYTTAHPDTIGYRDPVVNLHSVTPISPTVVTAAAGTQLRVGPGGA